MKNYYPYQKRNATKNYFPLPNEIFDLELSAGEIAVYSFLMRCENRKTYQCYPSYRTIGRAINASRNTVRKYIEGLCEKRLITSEPTTIITQLGTKRNGSLRYTIRPIEDAVRYNYEMQIKRNDETLQRQRFLGDLNDEKILQEKA
ncbi:MAG: helix-turn-helix domain-containing protein [Eubacterium sp.]|nr:helix-turn-helix domain-containing protein [Eubacterium sp.]